MVILTISNACGSSIDTIEIVLDLNGPDVDLGPDVLACEGDTVVLDAGISGVEYLWNDGSVDTRLIAYLPGIYYVQVSNACGMDSDTILVDIHGTVPAPSLGADTTLCEGEVLTLVSDADAETEIEWLEISTGVVSTSSTTDVLVPGTYVLTETNHCGVASDTLVVDFESLPPVFDLGEDMVICQGDTVFLNAPQTDNAILWETPDGTSTESQYFATLPGIVTLTISNHCGVVSDETLIEFDENEPVAILDPLSLCDGESITLDVTQSFDALYEWNTGSTSSVLQIVTPGNYSVSIITECYSTESSVQVTHSADCDPQIFIPNVFSPNGDGVNDVWEVLFEETDITRVECVIFDRWGNTVFGTNSMPIVWDGLSNGEPMLPGVYVYMLRIQKDDFETQVVSGSTTIIR
jgi:gliding motility-associated-like protein